jgi:alkanesulfonate monooxygenase SsuD/methylene tetrahydromethanopterin reductase-like flavin-dependent oxidoreductase (luciferase family)
LPKPLQEGGIPIWTGGHTNVALRRAGELADGWHPIGHRPPAQLHPAEYAEKVAVIHEWARKAGRDPLAITLSLRVPLELRPMTAKAPDGDRVPFRGNAAEVLQDIRAYQAVGVTHFIFDPVSTELRAQLATMERFADEVRPAARTVRSAQTSAAASHPKRGQPRRATR